ncbi:MAG: hypothetical protein IJH40_08785 [Ruminococcus sp.]|uniref:hypothetical protein n=1 Tax=Ruminococcus sp. TaxID=41978 RepID=UPI002872BA45|nr:hypothetical protein [Ruminococcus sp.]MBQ3285718.1 hypothetical protein [Ruminococcus sp.]
MQDMIKRIVEADREARALEEDNLLAAEKEKARIEEQAQAIHQKYMDQADEEIHKNEAYLEKFYERKLSEESAKQKSAMIKLRADFEENRDRWVDEIVSRVIG